MATTPDISVIVPTYNRAHLVAEAINSVLAQTLGSLEVIVIDDGSTDNTLEVLQTFNDVRIRVIHQHNMGIGGARNTGIRTARGKYIAFLDSDDIWLPELLATEVPVLEERPEIDIVYAKAQAMDATGNLKPQMLGTAERFPGEYLRSMLYGFFGCLPTTILRRECFDSVGLFDESLKGRVDWDMFLRISQYHQFHFINRVLARYRFHEGRTTGPKSPVFREVTQNHITVLDTFFAQPGLSEDILSFKNTAYRNAYLAAGMQFLNTRNRRETMSCFAHAMRYGSILETPLRILWLILVYNVLSKTYSGMWLLNSLVKLRQKRLAKRGGA